MERVSGMRIGFVGLGKLGLPCALAIEHYGKHEVMGYDVSEEVIRDIKNRRIPYREVGAQELLHKSNMKLASLDEVVGFSEIIFVPIQTPHETRYEGITRLPEDRANFDYRFITRGVEQVVDSASRQRKEIVLIIISTVLPGTIDREIRPIITKYTRLCYNPFFIAMGTTIDDFMKPEFVLLGCDDMQIAEQVKTFYRTLHDRPIFITDIRTAELIKVAYNTFIGMKIVFANTMMEICHKTGADVDDLTDALSMATDRLISAKYLRAGMGDGGGCHPRDNIAMSWLSRELNLSHDFFSDIMRAREDQTEWLARLILKEKKESNLPVVILGKAFKPETNLVVGSPAVLLKSILDEQGVECRQYDPCTDTDLDENRVLSSPAIFFLGTKHEAFKDYLFPRGSVVLDPWGYIPDREGATVVRIGRTRNRRPMLVSRKGEPAQESDATRTTISRQVS